MGTGTDFREIFVKPRGTENLCTFSKITEISGHVSYRRGTKRLTKILGYRNKHLRRRRIIK